MVKIGDSTLKITHIPRIVAPVVTPTTGVPQAVFKMTGTEALGTVTLDGAAGDSGGGWEVAFIQAQWIETNWGYYRGATNGDGSVFVQRARPPARARQACRDTAVSGAVFYVNNPAQQANPIAALPGPTKFFDVQLSAGSGLPATVTVFHQDLPNDFYDVVVHNTQTGALNFLNEVQLDFHFCTALTVKDAGNNYSLLKHFYWNVIWQYSFTALNTALGAGTPFRISPVKGGVGAHVSHVFDGAPNDHRFAAVLTTPQPKNCNDVARAATNNPIVRMASTWKEFDVRK
jgi:hypothetical protein